MENFRNNQQKSANSIRYLRYQQQQLRNPRRRAVFKNGKTNILPSASTDKQLKFVQDLFTSLVDVKWRYTLLILMFVYFSSWSFFSLIWWLIAYTHGDLEYDHLPINQIESNWMPCIYNIYCWTSCFLFSYESQTVIEYGFRYTSEQCPQAIFMKQIQWMAAKLIDCFMAGVIFVKLTRPKLKRQTVLFSKNAVINQRDDDYCLMFRIGDMSITNCIGGKVRALLIHNSKQSNLPVKIDGCDSNLFFIWPMTIVHRIDNKSPLYHLSAADLHQQHLEIIVLLECTVESTGQTIQARSSYLTNEILWGHRFKSIIAFNKNDEGYEINFNKFNNIYPIDMPTCSAEEYQQHFKTTE